MKHYTNTVYYAEDGEYVTLSGMPYSGPFHAMSSGILMTGAKHSMKSEVIVQTADRTKEKSNPLPPPRSNTTLNENDTAYDLLPELVNSPPIIIKSIGEASTPQVKPSAAAGTLDEDYMYIFPDGNVKVHAGVSITLKVEAEQPPIFNVENGLLEIKDPQEGLVYRWFVDGEAIVGPDIDASFRASRIINGNTLTLTNMIPRYAGVYTCVVSNDIGSTDGGSLSMEVYNSNVDSFFYTNLVSSPNGRDDEGGLGLDGWESLAGSMVPRQFARKTIGERDKSIVVDPMDQKFQWSKEMMFPRPYQLDGGVLQNNPLRNINTYITRDKYQYKLNSGTNLAQIYQDIDIEPLMDHVRGSIYGVSGVTAIISFYIGNAIFNYEFARPYLTPDTVAARGNYYLGAARLSLENFIKMGPGTIKEEVTVQIEEYENDTRLKSGDGTKPIIIKDPWNARLGKYSNQVYYEGGTLTLDGSASGGGKPDRILFVADELFPTQESRYTYGQYAEFQKVVLPKLNPRTNKIRLLYTIQAQGDLDSIMNGSEPETFGISDGILAFQTWKGSFESGKLLRNPNAPNPEDKPYNAIKDNYRTNAPSFEQRYPKQSISRAFATGFNVTLVPTGPAQNNESSIQGIYSKNTRVEGLVPSPVQSDPIPFDPLDTGVRDLTITFTYYHDTNRMGIQMIGRAPTSPETTIEQIDSADGLIPFALGSDFEVVVQGYDIDQKQALILNPQTSIRVRGVTNANGTITPPYLASAVFDIDDNIATLVQLRNIGESGNPGTTQGRAPEYPKSWYTIDDLDKLTLFKNIVNNETEPLKNGRDYPYWATPSQPLELTSYANSWNDNQKMFRNQFATNPANAGLIPTTTQWESVSRFVITVGVHNTNFAQDDPLSLHAIDNYYLDFVGNKAIIHKTPYNGIPLPSFDKDQQLTDEDKQALADATRIDGPAYRRDLIYRTNTDGQQPEGDADIYYFLPNGDNVDMVPVEVEVSRVTNSNDEVASFELPITLLKEARENGGLNIPEASEPPKTLTNAVDGTTDFYKNTPPTQVPRDVYEENQDAIFEVLDKQIEDQILKISQSEINFYEFYDYTLPYDDAKQAETLIINEPGKAPKIIPKERIPEDSVLMVLGRRKYILQQIYNSLITAQEIPQDSTLSAKVFDESNIQPTEAEIYVTYGGEIDPSYKVILYGVRPAPFSPRLDDNQKYTGTPLSGIVNDKEFTIKNIAVMNTGSL